MAHVKRHTILTEFEPRGLFLQVKNTHPVTEIKKQFSKSHIAIAFLFMLTFIMLGSVYLLSEVTRTSPENMTRDVVATAKLPVYTGIISNLGILGWAIASVICFLGYCIVARNQRFHIFLLSSAAISAILCLDDMLLLHEQILPKFLPHAEILTFVFYAGLISGYLWAYRDIIPQTEYLLLGTGLLFFGASMGIDQILPDVATFIEDGCKFIGIAFWMTYFFRVTVRWIRDEAQSNN